MKSYVLNHQRKKTLGATTTTINHDQSPDNRSLNITDKTYLLHNQSSHNGDFTEFCSRTEGKKPRPLPTPPEDDEEPFDPYDILGRQLNYSVQKDLRDITEES